MENLKNLSKLELMEDGAMICKLEMYDDWNDKWETLNFVYRSSDKAPTSRWVEEQIQSGNAPEITIFVPPPPPPAPVVDTGTSSNTSSGPTVA